MKKLMIALGAIAAATVTFAAQADNAATPDGAAKPEAAELEEEEEEGSSLFEVALQFDVNSAYVSHNQIGRAHV